MFEDKQAMLWTRGMSVDPIRPGNRLIIHGHTPKPLTRILKSAQESVINIDGGCVFTGREGLGNLVAFNVTKKTFLVQEYTEH